MSATSRKTARAALATLLNAALIGVSKPTQEVLAYPPTKITTSPLVFVRSAGTFPKRQGIGGTKGYNRFRFEIMVYVLAAETAGPTPAQSADALDDIEAAIRDVLLANHTNTGVWASLDMPQDFTNIFRLPGNDTGGKPYDVEIIPVEVEVYDP